jgi:peptidyl-prolyl cis-trans isomerase B (cyclophilin B)
MRRLLTLFTVLAIALIVVGCGSSGKKDSGSSSGSSTTEATQTTTTDTGGTPPVGANGCQQVAAPPAKPDGGAKKPKGKLDASKTWTLDVRTSCGVFTIKLDLDAAPNASASMVSLAKSGFFEDTVFHRIVPGFVIQGGDPTGTGSGGPGYTTIDKPPANAKYTRGVVAMAKAGNEPPGAAGSQFYVVTGPDAGLPPDYAIVGKISDGADVVQRIGKLGDPSTEQPTEAVVIDDVEVSEG